MDLELIRLEIAQAKNQFEYVESHVDAQGNPYVLAAIQTSTNRFYTLAINFPDKYPYAMPRVRVREPSIRSSAYHLFSNGTMCYQHESTWNPGRHDLIHVIARAAKWLNKYEVWLQTNRWPGKEIRH